MSSNTKTKVSKAKGDTKLSEEQRQHGIVVAAYYIAERSEFNYGRDLNSWLAAEAEIDWLQAEGKL